MGAYIALHNLDTPEHGLITPGQEVPADYIETVNVDNLLRARLVFYVYEDDELEPLAQWQAWGGMYPPLLREAILVACGQPLNYVATEDPYAVLGGLLHLSGHDHPSEALEALQEAPGAESGDVEPTPEPEKPKRPRRTPKEKS